MKRYRVTAGGVEVGTFVPTRAYDSPPTVFGVFGRFTPCDAFSAIASLFACSDERNGSDWDDSPEVIAERARLALALHSEVGERIPTESIMLYDFGKVLGCEMTVYLASCEQRERLLREAAAP